MSKVQIIAAIGNQKRKIRVIYNNEFAEYIVQVFENGVYMEELSYYTDDKNDALSTAKHMHSEIIGKLTYTEQCKRHAFPLDEIAEAIENNEGIGIFTNERLKAFVAANPELIADLEQYENCIFSHYMD